ncbi:uncharacterized protein [Parasteatoda tepidariorum]|uniref:uncharacterized protein n=1 Tax=Parasteatoda tepidariorum TaxID=114398 RepID=UPI0039BC26F4
MTIGPSPAELLMGKKLRTVLDRLHPDLTVERKLSQEQDVCKKYGDFLQRSFSVDHPVFVKNYKQGPKWFPATVIKPTSPVSYQAVRTGDDIVKHHVDQMQKYIPDHMIISSDPSVVSLSGESQSPEIEVLSSIPTRVNSQSTVVEPTISKLESSSVPVPEQTSRTLRPRHTIVRPSRFKDQFKVLCCEPTSLSIINYDNLSLRNSERHCLTIQRV